MSEVSQPPLPPQVVYTASWTGTSSVTDLYDPDVTSGTREVVFFVSVPVYVLFFNPSDPPLVPVDAATGWLAPGFSFRRLTVGPSTYQFQAATVTPSDTALAWWYFPGESP